MNSHELAKTVKDFFIFSGIYEVDSYKIKHHMLKNNINSIKSIHYESFLSIRKKIFEYFDYNLLFSYDMWCHILIEICRRFDNNIAIEIPDLVNNMIKKHGF